jgi:hypothetical protein
MVRGLLAVLVWCALALFGQAQTPSVNARLSEGIVKLGGRVTLLIEVDGAQSAQIGTLPTIDGLHLARPGPPSERTFMTIAQGQRVVQRILTFAVVLTPERKGEYKLPAIDVLADGRTLRTAELWLRVVEDLQGEQLGLFEVIAPKTVVEGQPFTVELRFGWEARQQGFNYANLSLPWYPNLGGLLELDAPLPEAGLGVMDGITINGQGNCRAEQLPKQRKDDGEYFTMRLRRRFLATRPGTLEFPVSHFEFGAVSQDFLLQREKRAYYKRVPSFSMEVIALPEEGRELDYGGAVGTLKASASADRRDVDIGDSIKLTVEWRGEGNLEFFDVPELDRREEFRSFRYFGKASERKTSERRTVVFDIAPLSDKVVEIPPVSLPVFNPVTRSYEVVRTQPIPIRVRAKAGSTGLSEPTQPRGQTFDVRDIQTELGSRSEFLGPGLGLISATLALLVLLWLFARVQVRRFGDPASPRARARRRALQTFSRALEAASETRSKARAWHQFVGDRRGMSAAALEGADVSALAREWGLAPEHAHEWAQLERQLAAAVYGADSKAPANAQLESLARQLIGGGL